MSNESITEKNRFVGLLLSASRSKYTSIAVLDYYHGKGRLFVVESVPSMLSTHDTGMDKELCEHILKLTEGVPSKIYTNAPLTLPPCMRCLLKKCPGVDSCVDEATLFMMNVYSLLKKQKKNLKKFIPYTQRPEEVLLRLIAPQIPPPHEALGGSLAPITSRATFLKKILTDLDFFESYPKGNICRLVEALGLPSHYSQNYNDIKLGKRIRNYFISKLEQKTNIFIYDNDREHVINSVSLFEAVVLAFIGVLDYKGLVETPVSNYPVNQSYIKLPLKDLKL